ncbi:MAG: class I SAM-dependent methyltransferase [Bacillota bacterium]
MELKELLGRELPQGTLYYLVFSGLKKGVDSDFSKVTMKPVLLGSELHYQLTYHFPRKVTHENLTPELALEKLLEIWQTTFKQGQVFTKTADYQAFSNRDGRERIIKRPPSREAPELGHNRQKKYLLAEGVPHDFLVQLGVMNRQGKVLAQKYDKFRQINRFVELVTDVVDRLPQPADRPLKIIDFGSGKSYLTFALYYYLRQVRSLDVEILGLDLKQDVIDECSRIAKHLGYEQLRFAVGDIADYQGSGPVDMVVSLHACDTATDAALAKAVQWNAEVILAVPCCQHELAPKVHHPIFAPLEKHGIIKDRLATLITDTLRACALEVMGYDVQLVEFIDTEHTPKNVLIRAVRNPQRNRQSAVQSYLKLRDFWSLEDLYIERAFGHPFTCRLSVEHQE